MFLEERVEQLEHLAVDQGRQLEIVARGLADLTIDVRSIRQDQVNGFDQVNKQFEQVNKQFEQVNQRLDGHDLRFDEVNHRLDQMQTTQREMQTTQQLILTLLTERLK